MRIAVVLALPLVLAACAGSPIRMEQASEAELWNAQGPALCNAYHFGKSAKLRKVIAERVVVYPENWADVEAGRVKIGFTEDELICARGAPRKVNESVSAGGVRKQWVYDDLVSRRYFYTDGRHVTGWN